MKRTVCVSLLFAIVACSSGSPEPDTDGTWVGTITTEGNVTTVVNEAGSVWGGTARLVEEVSIGVAAGADEYMFGLISSVYVTKDRIYVVDSQVPAVRAYDHAGTFVGTLGRVGQGPGEYMRPRIVAADTSGRVFVLDGSLARVNVYAPSGETLDAFGAGGRYLGEVQMPPGIRPSVLHLVIDSRLVVGVVQNAEGTIMVKRYRLVLPGER